MPRDLLHRQAQRGPLSRSIPVPGGKVNVIRPRSQHNAATSRLNSPSRRSTRRGVRSSPGGAADRVVSIPSSSVSANMGFPVTPDFSASHL